MIWWILSSAAAVALLAYWGSRNAVWGTATFGALVGLVVALIRGFEWSTVGKAVVIGTFIGLVFEWLPRIVSRPTGRRGVMEVDEGPAEYESIRDKLTEDDVRELFSRIEANAAASSVDKAAARHGLSKILGEERAVIPTDGEIASLSLFFPQDLIDVLLEKRTI